MGHFLLSGFVFIRGFVHILPSNGAALFAASGLSFAVWCGCLQSSVLEIHRWIVWSGMDVIFKASSACIPLPDAFQFESDTEHWTTPFLATSYTISIYPGWYSPLRPVYKLPGYQYRQHITNLLYQRISRGIQLEMQWLHLKQPDLSARLTQCPFCGELSVRWVS